MRFAKRITLLSTIALMGMTPVFAKQVKAASTNSVQKTVMHNAAIYDKNGKNTGKVYKSYQNVYVDSDTVKIKGSEYYKVSNKDQYLKVGNIDGTKRTLTHNAYVYATSTRRANNTVLKKGSSVTTYGGSYKFKNGKRYYRVGGPKKQYVKVSNFSSVTNADNSTSSTSIVTPETGTLVTNSSSLYDKNGKPYTKQLTTNYVSNYADGQHTHWKTRLPYFGVKTIKGEEYYLIDKDNGVYVKSSDIREIVGQTRIKVRKNSKIYSKNGKVISSKLPLDRIFIYPGQVNNIEKASKYYYINNEGQPQDLPYTTIKGEDYYNVGNGQYVRVKDVSSINHNGLYTNYITVTTTKTAPIYDMNGKKTSSTIAKGKKIKVEGEDSNPQHEVIIETDDIGFSYDYYKIKGKDQLISFLDVDTTNPLISPRYFDENTPADMRISLLNDTPVYNSNGQRKDDGWFIPHTNGGSYSVNKLVYIYNPTDKKVELFYHLTSSHISLINSDDSRSSDGDKSIDTKDLYIKASDASYYDGFALKPSNTVEQAQASATAEVK
ncbi:hypothetical protein J2Z60_002129 [Lactobacillus colini]|uniref:S-layer protein C-terminal domain-containing protein n=1 Tax=Lactobacillus colini TaxID=1819254 RepID=A0ABS4MGX0_9LACO|nr:SLAP domain-containing protein [Lactobacillus colini]MBP2058938.1 hypothetical protein [Lactobacillus colini]